MYVCNAWYTHEEQDGRQPALRPVEIPHEEGPGHVVVAGEEEAAVIAPGEEADAEPDFKGQCWCCDSLLVCTEGCIITLVLRPCKHVEKGNITGH